MYEVKLINNEEEIIINAVSTNKEAPRITGQCNFGINTIDSFKFTILPNNIGFNSIYNLRSLVEVKNTKTNVIEFKGRVLLSTPKMSSSGLFSKSVVCESELGYLMDSVQSYGEYHNISVRGFLELIINNHNSQVSEDKRFTIGLVNVEDPNDSLYRYLNYEKTLDAIKDKLIDRLGGELQIRHENGVRYLDYLKSIGEKKSTEIRLSKNLLTIEQERDPSDVITRLIPLGAKLDNSEERLTISSANNGAMYIDDEEAIKEFGIIVNTETWDAVTVAENLLRKGKEYLSANNKIRKKHDISALDLFTINLDIESFEVGNTHRVVNPIMGIDEDLRIIEKTLDINAPQNSRLSVGDKFEDIKDYQLDTINTTKEVKNVKSTVQTTVNVLNSVSTELNNTVEVLNTTNQNLGNLSEVVQANIDATNVIANTLVAINTKLDKLTRRIAMEV